MLQHSRLSSRHHFRYVPTDLHCLCSALQPRCSRLALIDSIQQQKPSASIAFTYACDSENRPNAAWGQLAARFDLKSHFDRNEAHCFEPSTLPSYGNLLAGLGYSLFYDEAELDVHQREKVVRDLSFFPYARVMLHGDSLNSNAEVLDVRLLELRVQHHTVGVAVFTSPQDDKTHPVNGCGEAVKSHWHCLHPQPNVRLCALLALRGVARMMSIQPQTFKVTWTGWDLEAAVNHVVATFEHELKHRPALDLWAPTDDDGTQRSFQFHGKQRFASTVRYFVQRRMPIPFFLPAFPCKSSNKVSTDLWPGVEPRDWGLCSPRFNPTPFSPRQAASCPIKERTWQHRPSLLSPEPRRQDTLPVQQSTLSAMDTRLQTLVSTYFT